MAINTIPGGGGASISIKGRPHEHENTIDRQGQLVRLIQARKCPCIKNGRADLLCTLCKGRGYLLSYQEEYEVIEENSPHFGTTNVRPWKQPIESVKKVQRWVNHMRGGNIFYKVDSFDSESITLVDNGMLPKRHEPIKVTYSVRNAEQVIGENCNRNGYTLYTIGTEIDTEKDTSNPKDVHGNITSVSRVYNKTQDYTYIVKSFIKQAIYIDSTPIEVPPVFPETEPTFITPPVPLSTDILEVDYKYIVPFRALFTRIDIQNSVVKYFEDVKIGDIKMSVKAHYHVGRGDIVTMLTTIVKDTAVIIRGAGTKDELPVFDAYDILEDIEDELGNHYINGTHFRISDYNDLLWLGSTKPTTGKKYTVVYRYRPSYIVYRQMPSPMNAGDRDYPQSVFLRYIGRLTDKDLV